MSSLQQRLILLLSERSASAHLIEILHVGNVDLLEQTNGRERRVQYVDVILLVLEHPAEIRNGTLLGLLAQLDPRLLGRPTLVLALLGTAETAN